MSRVLTRIHHWRSNLLALAAVAAFQPPAPPEAARSANAPYSAAAPSRRVVWELEFPPDITPDEYARQLDFFGIEIAAVSKSGKVDYIAEVSRARPRRRMGQRAHEYRLAIGWKQGALVAADRKLLGKVGISTRDKELLHFFPAATQAIMQHLEQDYAGGDASSVSRTRFQIRPAATRQGYRLVVVEQDPPPERASSAP